MSNAAPDYCPACAYDLTGVNSEICPECGQSLTPDELEAHRRRINDRNRTMAVLGLISLAPFAAAIDVYMFPNLDFSPVSSMLVGLMAAAWHEHDRRLQPVPGPRLWLIVFLLPFLVVPIYIIATRRSRCLTPLLMFLGIAAATFILMVAASTATAMLLP